MLPFLGVYYIVISMIAATITYKIYMVTSIICGIIDVNMIRLDIVL